MATATLKYSFDEDILGDLLDLAGYADRLALIVSAAAEPPAGSGFATISRHVARKLELSREEGERVLNTLQNIGRSQVRIGLDVAQIVDAFTQNIEQYAKDKEQPEIHKTWQAASKSILAAVKDIGPDHPLSVARKAERVYYSHQNLLSEARIITDLRPVFDRTGEKVMRMMVTHSLLIEYFEASSVRRVEIGLDAAEVADLRRACERAEAKAVALKDAVNDKPWLTTFGLDEGEQ